MGILVKNYDQTRLYGNEVEKYYLTFEALEDCTFTFTFYGADPEEMNNTISEVSYSVDNGATWVSKEWDEEENSITTPTVKKGDKVLWKGNGFTNDCDYDPDEYCYFTSTGGFNVYGNIMSLVYGDDFFGKDTIISGNTFTWLFGETPVVSTEYLVLPTTLAKYCYISMFTDCHSLTTAPELPALTLAQGCYASMFNNCESLTTAPVLTALALDSQSYEYMFYGCSSLNYIKMLATDISESDCLRNWVEGVAEEGTLVININYDGLRSALNVPATWTILNEDGTPHIFPRDYSEEYLTFEALEDGSFGINWTVEFLTDASDDLMKHISYSVDNGETWTTQEINDDEGLYVEGIKAGQTILWKGDGLTANSGNDEYINFVASTGGSNAKFNVYGNIMSLIYGDDFEGKEFNNDVEDTMGWLFENSHVVSAKNLILPDNVFASCYQQLFQNCTELTEAPELPATTLANGCYADMFQGCTSLVNAPVLPATTLVSACYAYMFNGCTNLNYIKALFTTTPSNTYTRDWLKNVAATGTFVKNSTASWTTTGTNAVPSGWTVETASA